MRVGQNPAKQMKSINRPSRITVAVLNYIPFQKGYFSDSFQVLQRCLNSILENTELPYDLLVFDNGSCPEVKQYLLDLQAEGRIQYLIFSEKNIGKGGAWEIIFNAAPGEIIAYSDNDAYFYRGWLKESVQVLETYPNVGMVTARPLKTVPELSTSTLHWAVTAQDVHIEEGDLISYEDFYEFSSTLGYSEEKLRREYDAKKDIRVTYKGVKAFIGANHFQFTGWKKILQSCTPFNMQKPLGQVKLLDERLNEGGYLRLMTDRSLIQNMSNRIPQDEERLVQKGENRFQIKNMAFIKKPLLWLHDRIFSLYYEK